MSVERQSGVEFAIEKLPPLDGLENLWRCLEARSFFTSWDWIGTWLRTLPPEFDPQLVRGARGGKTVGLAIGMFRRSRRHGIVNTRQLHFNATGEAAFDNITIEHNDFVGESGLLPDFIQWFSRSDCAEELVLPGVLPANAPALPALLRSTRDGPAFANDALPTIARDGMANTLSRAARQQLNRNMRDLSRFGELSVEEADDPTTRLAWFGELKELHVCSWSRRGRRHAFSAPYFETFHRALVLSRAVQLLRIRAGERLLGYLYNFRFDDTVYAYQSGFADENGRDRPGYVSHALAIGHCARQGATRYDFLAGDNRLKHSFGPSRYALCWITYARPSVLLRLEAAARWLRENIKAN
jgi:CelD/BcsL family acetyltransferase involved in cellulose biosynthesis